MFPVFRFQQRLIDFHGRGRSDLSERAQGLAPPRRRTRRRSRRGERRSGTRADIPRQRKAITRVMVGAGQCGGRQCVVLALARQSDRQPRARLRRLAGDGGCDGA